MMGGGKAAKVSAIHAGLECGILGEKYPGMDTVSFGPTIKGAHSPDERVQVSTVEPFWHLTVKVLERLADVRA
ncbi:Cytosol non-specific dipeptidase [Tetrabaena socialis]|uniref:Cytosol non-specific dipeptidase n=1 Tax=Tetrabaena socialis TaxID=47790 RepID=A0A2J7ZXS4_9CHLO|nr:Cytosol non-specific dipeptidase [Tetrabaena socialis]|eukprot:PNH05068.1 Cytosol non-specific dipeptidase [Tetrabaena socialis]